MTKREPESTTQQSREFATRWGKVSISEDNLTLEAIFAEPDEAPMATWIPPLGGVIYAIHVKGKLIWISHQHGLTLLQFSSGIGLDPIDTLHIPGPVENLFPLRTFNGVAYVSVWGGFGTVVYEPRVAASKQ